MYTAPAEAQSVALKASRRPTLDSGVNHQDRIRAVTVSLGFRTLLSVLKYPLAFYNKPPSITNSLV